VRVKELKDQLVVTIDLSKDVPSFYEVAGIEETLLSWGASVNIIDGTFSIPDGTNVLLIPSPRASYSAEELEEIGLWFSEKNQRRLLWVAGDSDFNGYFTPEACNGILSAVGANLRISADTVEDPVNYDGLYWNGEELVPAVYRVAVQTPVSDGDLNSIFITGVESSIFHGPTSVLGYQDGAVVDLMVNSIDSVELIMRASEDAVYNNHDGTEGEFDYYSYNDIYGSFPMMAIQTVFDQKYVIASGEVIFSDYMHMYDTITDQGYWNNPNPWNNGIQDGKILVDNILYWFWHTY
jgi:hypothetical protein